jgi:hypothetical protein
MIYYFESSPVLLTDQKTHFQNKLFDEFAKLFGINQYSTMSFRAQSRSSIRAKTLYAYRVFKKVYQ